MSDMIKDILEPSTGWQGMMWKTGVGTYPPYRMFKAKSFFTPYRVDEDYSLGDWESGYTKILMGYKIFVAKYNKGGHRIMACIRKMLFQSDGSMSRWYTIYALRTFSGGEKGWMDWCPHRYIPLYVPDFDNEVKEYRQLPEYKDEAFQKIYCMAVTEEFK